MLSPPVVAHRGLAAKYPENTLIGLRAALAAGARFLEVDLQLSADGVAFVHHDWETARTCGVGGSIGERSSEELSALSASYAERFGAAFTGEPLRASQRSRSSSQNTLMPPSSLRSNHTPSSASEPTLSWTPSSLSQSP